jgi:glutathione S-transferase
LPSNLSRVAILQYLVRHHDPDHKLSFTSPADMARADQWINFMQGDLTPAGTNSVRFYRFLPQKHNFPLQLFHRESLRCCDILNAALQDRDYLVGPGRGKYSVADIANFTYVNNSCFVGIGTLEKWPNLRAWQQRIWAREAVKRGVDVPYPAISTNEVWERTMAEDGEFRAGEEKLREALERAMEEFPPVGPPK